VGGGVAMASLDSGVLRMWSLALRLVIGVLSASILGCGSNQNLSGSGATEVIEIQSNDSTIPLGGGSVIKFNFSFDHNEVFTDDGKVYLVVKLPPQLAYRDNSAELDRLGSHDRDEDPSIKTCSSGESFLAWTFDQSDLRDSADPLDGGDAQLKLTVEGTLVGEFVTIEAAADDGMVRYECAREFRSDEEEVIRVEQ
jgi:hypothetical protein